MDGCPLTAHFAILEVNILNAGALTFLSPRLCRGRTRRFKSWLVSEMAASGSPNRKFFDSSNTESSSVRTGVEHMSAN
jgi:hypothetical protein